MLANGGPSEPQPSAARHKRVPKIECCPGRQDSIEKEDEIWVSHFNPTRRASPIIMPCFHLPPKGAVWPRWRLPWSSRLNFR
jgi:hypothetical protein